MNGPERARWECDGPGCLSRLELTQRHIHLTTEDRIVVSKVVLTDCTIETGLKRRGLWWYRSQLTRCSFIGRYEESTFGPRLSDDYVGSVLDCDFSAASLHECLFCDVAEERIKFASWPTIVARMPQATAATLRADWPETLYNWKLTFALAPSIERNVSFIVFDARALAKQTKTKLEVIEKLVRELPDAFVV